MKDFINTDYKTWGFLCFFMFFTSFLIATSIEYGLSPKLAVFSFTISLLITGFYIVYLYALNLFFHTLSFFQALIFNGAKA